VILAGPKNGYFGESIAYRFTGTPQFSRPLKMLSLRCKHHPERPGRERIL
jgi:hypothetical protein